MANDLAWLLWRATAFGFGHAFTRASFIEMGPKLTVIRKKAETIAANIATSFGRRIEAAAEQSKFVDLAPTDKADKEGVYSEALLYATNNPRVSNIALTGPYGSGKSSIIKSFLTRYRRPVLQISLAAFLPEAASTGGEVSKQEIERSILQQLLYGADANKLPLSRFRRIRSPKRWSIFVSLYAVLGVFACWHLFKKIDQISTGAYFVPFAVSNWFDYLCFIVGFSFVWLAIHRLYVASFGLSLKSISLKDIEITPAAITQESILNRHLDEIIYFFQSTNYDLVVIEDLDRFNNTDIFVTLREINSLLNENSGIRRTIRFLYALRDDMFVNTDRTKFFEFIVPVIPIINSSNSIDMVLAQGKRLALHDRLDRQFLREVSRYLDDLRLIQNIFNEYAIYVANLDRENEHVLDANKLLAVLIYKNVFPRDFENLHRGRGALAQILSRHDELIVKTESKYRAEIADLEGRVQRAAELVIIDAHELRSVYAMALIAKLPVWATRVGINWGNMIGFADISESALFDQLINSSNVVCGHPQGGQQQNVDIAGLQSEVDPDRTYEERLAEVELSSVDARNAASKKMQDLRSRMSTLRAAKFNEVIRRNADDLEDVFAVFAEKGELARYLVFEGYLDDTYYQYTSLFHSGRLSPHDNKYLIQIRDFVNPAPDAQIDNPKEVIAGMRDEDFRQSYVLNVKIVDCLLSDESGYSGKIASLFNYIATNFTSCEEFFATFYATGANGAVLIPRLMSAWPEFVPAAIASSKSASHVARMIAYLPTGTLKAVPQKYPDLAQFISVNLSQILEAEVDIEPDRLKVLGVEIADLAAIESHSAVARILVDEGLYKITIGNLEFIFRSMLGQSDLEPLRIRNYTTIVAANDTVLNARIDGDFEAYLHNVLLGLDANSDESVASIQAVIARDQVDADDIAEFLQKQSAVLPSLDQVPTRLHALLFRHGKIEPSWANCLEFMASENFDAEIFTAFLAKPEIVAVLAALEVPAGDDASALRKFLIEAADLPDDAYRAYMADLPKTFSKFPENLAASKLLILIEERRVSISPQSLSALSEHPDLQILFGAANIQSFLAKQADFEIDDEFRERLLRTDIADVHKLTILHSMDLTLLAGMSARAAVIGSILNRTDADTRTLDAATARAIIVSSAPISVQISLFNKCQPTLSDDEVREILASLPRPFSEIKTGYNVPMLENTAVNIAFVKWLDDRNIISSWGEALFSNDIRINLYRR